MKNITVLIYMLIAFSNAVFAQRMISAVEPDNEFPLTGNIALDSKINLTTDSTATVRQSFFFDERKVPLKAAAYSAIIPGLGELYSESYWTAATFFVAEVMLLSTSIYYEDLANKKEEEFEAIANDPVNGWFVDKYAHYLIDYNVGSELSNQLKSAMGSSYNSFNAPGNRSWWSLLNQLERSSKFSNGQSFSHVLPAYDSQQYYELIGKYDEFSTGWHDYNLTGGTGFTPTKAFLDYRDLRSKANDIHNLASYLTIGVFLNHIGSAVNAALQANWYNKNAHLSLRQQTVFMERTYLAELSVNF